MIETIKDYILDELFYAAAKRCDYCLRKAKYYLFDDINYSKAKFWNTLAKWFNKMERKVLHIHYGEAR